MSQRPKKKPRQKKTDLEKKIIEAEEQGDLNTLVSLIPLITEHWSDWDKLVKDKVKRCLSSCTAENVKNLFAVSSLSFPRFSLQKCRVPDRVMTKLFDRVENDLEIRGVTSKRSEPGREKFIDAIVDPLLRILQPAGTVKYEEPLATKVANGRGEYVFKLLHMVILSLANTTVLTDEEVAQLMMELYVAHRLNYHNQTPVIPVMGILSSAVSWVVYTFDGAKFHESTPINVETFKNEKGVVSYKKDQVTELASSMYWVLLDSASRSAAAWIQSTEGEVKEELTLLASSGPLTPRRSQRKAALESLQGALGTASKASRSWSVIAAKAINADDENTSEAVAQEVGRMCIGLVEMKSLFDEQVTLYKNLIEAEEEELGGGRE